VSSRTEGVRGNTRVVVLPPVPALLPSYLGRVDPVAALRGACHDAIAWLTDGDARSVRVLADLPDQAARHRGVDVPLGVRVARSLLDDAKYDGAIDLAGPAPDADRLLVLANGSGCRSEKAPGHLDPRSFAFDEQIETALAAGDSGALTELDAGLGRDLLAAGIEPLKQVGALGLEVEAAALRYADDPYGVRYWVATWQCRDRRC
jgi:hypothetical protein